jgi:antitoxin component of RelBE/YafQ-DinJ toxin-antitoxin module
MKKAKQTSFNLRNTGVNPIRTHGFGVWGNRRVVMSVRVDEKLKKEATKVLKAVFGSTCRGVEAYLAGLVATYQQQGVDGVYPRSTCNIGKLVIERNLRSRRRMVEEEVEVAEKIVGSVTCVFPGCSEVAEFVAFASEGSTLNVCKTHLKHQLKIGVVDGYRPMNGVFVNQRL